MKPLLTLLLTLFTLTATAQHRATINASSHLYSVDNAGIGAEFDFDLVRATVNTGYYWRKSSEYVTFGGGLDIPIIAGSFIGAGMDGMLGQDKDIGFNSSSYTHIGYRFGKIDVLTGFGWYEGERYIRPLSIRFAFN